jgi:hypothetical protein
MALLIEAFILLGCASVMAQEKQQGITNLDVVEMVHSGMSEEAIISAIKAAKPDFEITNDSTIALSKQKVPERVILAMIRRQLEWNQVHRKVQAPSRPAVSVDSGPKWEIEFHGGISGNHDTGGWQQPPDAETYSLAGSGAKGYWGKRVSSWYFGDGADLIGLSSSLDRIFVGSKPVMQPQGQMFGFRASRALTKWMAAEFTFDRSSKWMITENALAQLEAARASFENRWKRLNVPGNMPASSVSTIYADGGRQSFITGAAVLSLPLKHNVSPYLTVGCGIVSSSNSAPSITLVGSYGGPSALETDTVRMTFVRSSNRVFTQLFGGGAKFYVTRHWGFRIDYRIYLYHNPITTLLDVNHTNTPDEAWIVNATDAAGESVAFLQKLSGPGLEAYSSLSGPSISALRTFFGAGNQRQIPLTFGFFWRF